MPSNITISSSITSKLISIGDAVRSKCYNIPFSMTVKGMKEFVKQLNEPSQNLFERLITDADSVKVLYLDQNKFPILEGYWYGLNHLQHLEYLVCECTNTGWTTFKSCPSLRKAYFPYTSAIEFNVFANCSNMTEFYGPNVTKIQNGAFWNCQKLNRFSVSDVSEVGDEAFYLCKKLSSINFLSNLSNIASSAFNQCHSLNLGDNITLNVAQINKSAFGNCYNLTKNLTINCTSNIEQQAFTHCSSLSEVTINCTGKIGSYAFSYCTSLNQLTVNQATEIGSSAFAYCSSLNNATINCPVIRSSAFRNCTNLTSISLFGVKSLYSYIFASCDQLISVYINSISKPPMVYSTAFGVVSKIRSNFQIHVPSSLQTSFAASTSWTKYFSSYLIYDL